MEVDYDLIIYIQNIINKYHNIGLQKKSRRKHIPKLGGILGHTAAFFFNNVCLIGKSGLAFKKFFLVLLCNKW